MAQIGQYALILALVVALAQVLMALAARAMNLAVPKGIGGVGAALQLLFAALAVFALLVLRPSSSWPGGPAWIVWAGLTLMTVLAAVTLTVPLARWSSEPAAPAGAKTKKAPPPEPAKPGERLVLAMALGLAAVVVVGGAGLVAVLKGPPGSAEAPPAAADHPGGNVSASIAQLEDHLKTAPDDGEGWATLGWSYMRVSRYPEAVRAYGRATELEPKQADLLSEYGQAIMAAAGGQVTPEAKAVFQKALAGNAGDPAARYFLALAKDQAGDGKTAMDEWIALIASAPPGAPWVGEIRARVEQTANARGLDISARLPAAPKGPTADDVAQASKLPAHEQQAMISGMVESLEARLKTDPHDPAGWEMLMRSRVNLGQMAAASTALQGAIAAYKSSNEQQAAFRRTARSLGIPGA